MASTIAWLPPRGHRPADGVGERPQQQPRPGRGEPARRQDRVRAHARSAGPERRHRRTAGSRPGLPCSRIRSPSRAVVARSRGTVRKSESSSPTTDSQCSASGPSRERQAAPSGPSPSAVRSGCPARPARPGRRPAAGRRRPPAGASRRPVPARSKARKNGEATAIGCTAEQTSCRKPGSVSSAVRAPPPIVVRGLDDLDLEPGGREDHRSGQPVRAGRPRRRRRASAGPAMSSPVRPARRRRRWRRRPRWSRTARWHPAASASSRPWPRRLRRSG